MKDLLIMTVTHLLSYGAGLATGVFVLYKTGEELDKKYRDEMLEE